MTWPPEPFHSKTGIAACELMRDDPGDGKALRNQAKCRASGSVFTAGSPASNKRRCLRSASTIVSVRLSFGKRGGRNWSNGGAKEILRVRLVENRYLIIVAKTVGMWLVRHGFHRADISLAHRLYTIVPSSASEWIDGDDRYRQTPLKKRKPGHFSLDGWQLLFRVTAESPSIPLDRCRGSRDESTPSFLFSSTPASSYTIAVR